MQITDFYSLNLWGDAKSTGLFKVQICMLKLAPQLPDLITLYMSFVLFDFQFLHLSKGKTDHADSLLTICVILVKLLNL